MQEDGEEILFWSVFLPDTLRQDVECCKLEQIETTAVFQLYHLEFLDIEFSKVEKLNFSNLFELHIAKPWQPKIPKN